MFGNEEVDGEYVEEVVDEEDGVITSTLTIQLERKHSKAMLIFTFVTTKYSTPSQVVPLVMPFPNLSLEPLKLFSSGGGKF